MSSPSGLSWDEIEWPLFEVHELRESEFLHLMRAKRPLGVRASYGCVRLIGFEDE